MNNKQLIRTFIRTTLVWLLGTLTIVALVVLALTLTQAPASYWRGPVALLCLVPTLWYLYMTTKLRNKR